MGNTYAQTMQVINMALQKLCKVSTATKLYRGISNALPPRDFLTVDEFGVCGGLDYSPCCCSPIEDISIAWCRKSEVRVVLEIHGGVDRGGHVSPFSTYPELDEYVLPACTYMQVQSVRVRKIDGLAFLYIDVMPQLPPA